MLTPLENRVSLLLWFGRLFLWAKVHRLMVLYFCKVVYYTFLLIALMQYVGGKEDNPMKIFAILIVSFIGICSIIHICSKNNYAIKYTSDKRKIEIHPVKDKSHQTHNKDKA